MKVIAKSDAVVWCRARGIALDEHDRPTKPETAAEFRIPGDAGRRVALVNGQLRDRVGSEDTLVWFTEWGVWPSSERRHIFDRFRVSYGEQRQLTDAPAHIVAAGEREILLSLVTLGVLFLWDVYVVAASKAVLGHYSHDEWGWLYRGAVAEQPVAADGHA